MRTEPTPAELAAFQIVCNARDVGKDSGVKRQAQTTNGWRAMPNPRDENTTGQEDE